jgi:hypothetical protein
VEGIKYKKKDLVKGCLIKFFFQNLLIVLDVSVCLSSVAYDEENKAASRKRQNSCHNIHHRPIRHQHAYIVSSMPATTYQLER